MKLSFTSTSARAEAKLCRCSEGSLLWLKEGETLAQVMEAIKIFDRWPQSGRLRATTAKQDQQGVALAEQQPFVTRADIMDQLKKMGVEISERTVRWRLHEAE